MTVSECVCTKCASLVSMVAHEASSGGMATKVRWLAVECRSATPFSALGVA